jgi:hypothetical protein
MKGPEMTHIGHQTFDAQEDWVGEVIDGALITIVNGELTCFDDCNFEEMTDAEIGKYIAALS